MIAGVVLKCANELEEVKLVDEVRSLLKRPERKPLHFRDLRHEHRVPYAERISGSGLRAFSILVHKPSLMEPENFAQGNRLYFYATRYLLERVSWYCRDHRPQQDTGDGSVEVVFSNRSGMSYESLRGYLKRLEANSPAWGVTIDWNVINCDQVRSLCHGKRMGLQIADAVASSAYYAVQPSQYGFTEDRYLRILLPRFYRYKGSLWGYGIKLWPKEAEAIRARGEVLSEVK